MEGHLAVLDGEDPLVIVGLVDVEHGAVGVELCLVDAVL